MKNLTYDQLIELAPKDRPFQIEVETPTSDISYKISREWAYITSNYNLWTINDSYGCNFWKTEYKGTFTLIDPRYQKPEVLKVGQKVRIMESAKDVGEWIVDGAENLRNMASLETKIDEVWDNEIGVNYRIGKYKLPHYCVMPVEEEEGIKFNSKYTNSYKKLIEFKKELENELDKMSLISSTICLSRTARLGFCDKAMNIKNLLKDVSKELEDILSELSDTDKEIIKSKLK
jgi:hypothetical protein